MPGGSSQGCPAARMINSAAHWSLLVGLVIMRGVLRRFCRTTIERPPFRRGSGLPLVSGRRTGRRRQQRIQLVVGSQRDERRFLEFQRVVPQSQQREQPRPRLTGAVPPSIYRHPVYLKNKRSWRLRSCATLVKRRNPDKRPGGFTQTELQLTTLGCWGLSFCP